jgi:hypothetical protein
MEIYRIPHNQQGDYTVFIAPDFEFANPIKYFSENLIQLNMTMERKFLETQKFPIEERLINKVLFKRAQQEWKKKYQELINLEIPINFISLLSSASKKEQVQLLKGQSFTSDQLVAYIIKAWTDFGFTFSQYRAEHHHNGLDIDELPTVIDANGTAVETVGETSLTDGQLKHAVIYRQVIISKFLDNGNDWHCFFTTYKSLRGDESWGLHYHYISNKFGITREKVVSELKNKNYNLGTLPHIPLTDYRKPPTSKDL